MIHSFPRNINALLFKILIFFFAYALSTFTLIVLCNSYCQKWKNHIPPPYFIRLRTLFTHHDTFIRYTRNKTQIMRAVITAIIVYAYMNQSKFRLIFVYDFLTENYFCSLRLHDWCILLYRFECSCDICIHSKEIKLHEWLVINWSQV